MTIRILLIDDHTLFRSGVSALLQRQPDLEVVGEASDGVEGVKRAKQHVPDVILLDLNMPGLSGLETLQLLVEDLPDTAVVMLTVSEDADELTAAMRAGARGFLLKSIDADALVAAIRKAASGQPVITEHMTAKLVEQMRKPAQPSAPSVQSAARTSADALTAREREIVRELARGASNKEIARTLDLAESTVKIHVRNILRKLNLSSRVQVAIYAVGQDGMAGATGERGGN
ncbi:response regulator [Paraburkholderia unamae]|uniref:LuxR family two component transcriptional regulator n=1 Tax=Paraburkholderia unamae TaxID=219649 RepID=A0ABX5KW25_9BURK|nr:response regulator transcription factor [Paraburkholderia unamae]PVX97876.1 LuxR family two component transcriptional regulator [Paraburkholderia unamae]CAG9270197.1 DNA-binding transcriptional dual regulator NarL [Paraburkholderia unamae]